MNLRETIEHYVVWRQAHGAKFNTARNLLRQFLRHADGEASCDAVTHAQVASYLAGPVTPHRENKVYALTGFWQFAISRGYATRSPLPNREPRSRHRPQPFIYTHAELQRLLDRANIEASLVGAKQLTVETFRTLLLLLYGAGLRFSEATGLTIADVDLSEAILTIRNTKLQKSRLVPVGTHLANALSDYLTVRASGPTGDGTSAYFLTTKSGTRLASSTVQFAFDKLRRIAEVHGHQGRRELPRLHDLRHSFAVHSLTAWYRRAADVQRLLPVLSTYLGHSDLEGTKVYLTMTPELLQQASLRFEQYVSGGALK
jgi:site-specific recombinase XerD